MVRWLYIRTLEKLDKARVQINQELNASLGAIIPVDDNEFPISIEQAAKKADVSPWLARRATRWHERTMKYGA
jgi:hypothetical protein